MSDHYCCKKCGLRYDDCRCKAELSEKDKEETKKLLSRFRETEARRGQGITPPLGERKVRSAKSRRMTPTNNFQEFTVILKRPEFLSTHFENDQRTDIYIATITALDAQTALAYARAEVLDADRKDAKDSDSGLPVRKMKLEDYTTLAIIKGHPEVVAHGAITGWWN